MSDETYDHPEYDHQEYDHHDPGPAGLATPTTGRHPVNIGHLVMGVALLGLTGIWVLFEFGAIGSDDLRWLMPLPWLAAGVAGLLAVVLAGRRRGDGPSYQP